MLRVAVLASGRGSNLAALLAASRAPDAGYRIVGVFSDQADAGALALAREADIEAAAVTRRPDEPRAAHDARLFARVAEVQPNLIVCAGYMRIISAEALSQLAIPMINLHPSLLPLHPGLDTHARALAAGDAQHGCSVHVVTADLDAGPLLAQSRIAIEADDTPERLAARVLACEHRLLPATVRAIARGTLDLSGPVPHHGGVPLSAPLQLDPSTLEGLRA
ncbi:MAG: phosphoribosylglycinamide formyltransferase [Chiayiivirga sp.]|jgi:phosphoribosylglycinamide formyltransferase-1|uniref:Phosphoribosylglycinamide formyltransferase n=1 Tax=Denitratimonas tolerans TaxID=1338420 RepID=A0AAW9R885_9GAMM|nr:phosphoribosylglycinamide formyltransferase [Xanthomonadaceae bacterium]MDX9763567.1 phosphoribosylglycinamide formyltransferase [Chiayiivirga sp.]MEB2314621.1 phosphoribosylglycinamide formyltransferase [Xanthomonadaceae bacterium]HRO87114.1 phosphoribosylglycinamide formyltransferase [Chiayiivirga sp.]